MSNFIKFCLIYAMVSFIMVISTYLINQDLFSFPKTIKMVKSDYLMMDVSESDDLTVIAFGDSENIYQGFEFNDVVITDKHSRKTIPLNKSIYFTETTVESEKLYGVALGSLITNKFSTVEICYVGNNRFFTGFIIREPLSGVIQFFIIFELLTLFLSFLIFRWSGRKINLRANHSREVANLR